MVAEIYPHLGESSMLEKLILAAAITFSINFFVGVTSQQSDTGMLLGENAKESVSVANNPQATQTPLTINSVWE